MNFKQGKRTLALTLAGVISLTAIPMSTFADGDTPDAKPKEVTILKSSDEFEEGVDKVKGLAASLEMKQQVEGTFVLQDIKAKVTVADSNKANAVSVNLADFAVTEEGTNYVYKKDVESLQLSDKNGNKKLKNFTIAVEIPKELVAGRNNIKINILKTVKGKETKATFNSAYEALPKKDTTPTPTPTPKPVVDLNQAVIDYIGDLTAGFGSDGAVVKLPKGELGVDYKVTVKADKDTVLTVTHNGEAKDFRFNLVAGKVNYTISVIAEKDGKQSMEQTKTVVLQTNEKPVLNYAYIIDGGLVLNATSQAGMGKTPIYWRYSDESAFRAINPDFGYGQNFVDKDKNSPVFNDLFDKVDFNKYSRLDRNDYRIPVTIPCKVQIVLVDALGNKTPVVLEINKDNAKLYGQVPSYVDELFKKVDSTEGVKTRTEEDVLIVNKDTTVNLFEKFKNGIVKEFKNFNSRELVFTCEEFSNFDPFDIKFDKAGRYEFTVTLNDRTEEFKFTVLVMEGGNNIKSFKILKETKVNGDTFKAQEAFEFKTTDSKDPNPVGFYAKYDGKYYRLNDAIPFGTEKDKDAKKAEVEIKDLLNNKVYKATFIRNELEKVDEATARNMLKDIKGHWAEDYILNMVVNGVIKGYPDGNFKPDNMISKREVLAIIGRYASDQKGDAHVKAVKDEVKFQKAAWGDSDVEYALKRLPVNIFENDLQLDQAATREQVAYILAYNFNTTGTQNVELNDLDKAQYKTEIQKLVNAGTINGYPDGSFKPGLQITRAELTTMISRVPGLTATKIMPINTYKVPKAADKATEKAVDKAIDKVDDVSKELDKVSDNLEDLFK